MMESSIRVETNKQGFCRRHYSLMLERRNRLPVALMLQSHLAHVRDGLCKPELQFPDKGGSCFICSALTREYDRILENIAAVWQRDKDFRELYIQQKYVCLPDCRRMLSIARKKLRGAKLKEFSTATANLALNMLNSIKCDVDEFCSLYDYRNAGVNPTSADISTAIERAVDFLTVY